MRRSIKILPILLLFLVACSTSGGQLKPLMPTPTPGGDVHGEPLLVTFTELQADPYAYRDGLVRVTGSYFKLPPAACAPSNGPGAQWALIAENLRLDVLGLESLLRPTPRETTFTVDGFFRLYEGPLGCGKEPPASTDWYLEVVRIVQPNPLTLSRGIPVASGPSALPAVLPTPTATIPGSSEMAVPIPPTVTFSTPTQAATDVPSEGAANTGVGTPSLPDVATVTFTPRPTQSVTMTATPTTTPAAQTVTPTMTPTPTQTVTSAPTQPPPTAIPLDQGYPPGSTPLPGNTPPPSGYP